MYMGADGRIIPFRLKVDLHDELILSDQELAELSLIDDAEERQEFLGERARNNINVTEFDFNVEAVQR